MACCADTSHDADEANAFVCGVRLLIIICVWKLFLLNKNGWSHKFNWDKWMNIELTLGFLRIKKLIHVVTFECWLWTFCLRNNTKMGNKTTKTIKNKLLPQQFYDMIKRRGQHTTEIGVADVSQCICQQKKEEEEEVFANIPGDMNKPDFTWARVFCMTFSVRHSHWMSKQSLCIIRIIVLAFITSSSSWA